MNNFQSPRTYSQAFRNLYFADEIMLEAMKDKRELDLGESWFIISATKDVLEVPFCYRPKKADFLLIKLLEAGVVDYKIIPSGRDPIVDTFYENPFLVGNLFSKMQSRLG